MDASKIETAERPLRILMVTGIYPTPQKPHKGTFIKSQIGSLIEAGLEVDVIHPDPDKPTSLRYLMALGQALGKTLTKKYDIVHGHYSLWGAIARFYLRAPLVCSFLGDDILGTVTADGSYSQKGKAVNRLSQILCQLSGAVIVKSQEMKQRAKGPQEKIFVIPNGINFAQFRPIPRAEVRTTLGWDQERNYVVFCNNPDIPVKNFKLAQAAIEKLHERGVEAELIVANGISHETVMQYMNASNAVILSSVAEGSPNVVKEAMACNVPVVSTDVGDVREVIGRTEGCSVCPHDAEALAAGLERAIQHNGPTTGRDDIQYLDNARIAQRLIALYRKVLGEQVADEVISGHTKEALHV